MRAKQAGKLFENLANASKASRKFLEKFALYPHSRKTKNIYFLSKRGQIIYFKYFQGQNIYFQ